MNINRIIWIVLDSVGIGEARDAAKFGDKVIAINTDKNAPIMKSADSALVGDAAGVLNTLISDIENRSN